MHKYKKENETSYCLGMTLTFELLNRKPEIAERVYVSPKQKRDDTYTRLIGLCKKNSVTVIENNEKIFRELSDKENVMAIGEFRKTESSLNPSSNHIVLVNPSNMGNLGTIIRSMAAFGYLDLAIIRPGVDVFDPKTIRSTMGGIFNVRFKYYDSFDSYESEFPKRDLLPFMLKAKTELKQANAKEPFTLIFGNEATGLPDSFLEKGTPVIIDQSPLVDSINLDNAVSIALYHFKD